MSKTEKSAETLSIPQIMRMFPDDGTCIEWLEKVRWSNGPVCGHCGCTGRISQAPSKPHTYWCGDCRKHFNVQTGTILHGTRTSLQNWMLVIYSVMTARKGVSAMQLSKEIGVQYRTAWYMLHRVREACQSGEFKLDGVVEMDECFVGGKESNKHKSKKLKAGRGTVGKVPVMGARQRDGRTVAKPVENANMKTATGMAKERIQRGSTVYTDESSIYNDLPFAHDSVNHGAGEYVRDDVHTNGMESVWAVFKRSVYGTWHHVSPKHLHRYVNEATMRLNEGNVERDTIDRMESLARNMKGKRIKYAELVA